MPSNPPQGPAQTASKGDVKGPSTLASSWHDAALDVCGGLSAALAAQRARHKGRQPVVWRCGCKVSGLGDRLKGIVAAWMLANVLERPFLCEPFPSLAQHNHGVKPAGADWRSGYAAYAASDRTKAMFKNRAEAALSSPASADHTRAIEIVQTTPAKVSLVQAYIRKMGIGVDAGVLETEPFVGFGKNFTNDDATTVSHRWRAVYARATYCATRSLLRPTTALLGLLDETLAAAAQRTAAPRGRDASTNGGVAANTNGPLVLGLHVRFGGKWKDRHRARDGDALKIIECAWNMTAAHRAGESHNAPPTGAVWVLASDDVDRLERLVAQFSAGDNVKGAWASRGVVVTTAEGGKVEHVSKSVNGTDEDAVRRLWHDWFLLSEAHVCALVRSSFPRTACYASARRARAEGLVQQLVTSLDLGRYTRTVPQCGAWRLETRGVT